MCGIVGYVGSRKAAPILIKGLKNLEYRGYDSAGICSYEVSEPHNKINKFSFNKNFHQKEHLFEMKIFDFVKNENYYSIIGNDFRKLLNSRIKGSKFELCMKINISYPTLQRILRSKDYWSSIPALLKLSKELDIPEDIFINQVKQIKTKNSFPIEVKDFRISNPLMRILGHMMGDGGIHIIEREKKYRPFYVNNERILLNSFIEDVKTVFGDIPVYFRERVDHGDEVWLQTSIGHILYDILKYKMNKNKKRIPKFVYCLDEHLICSFIQAFYDDEGFLYPNKYMIVISQSSRKLLNDLRNLLIKIGINPNNILIHHPRNRTKMHYFSITHKDNIKKFYNKINFIHPIKKKKLQILFDKYR